MGFKNKSGWSSGISVKQPDGTFKDEIMSEDLVRPNTHYSLSRHTPFCTCSWCIPWSMSTYKPLPKPGKFGIEVPPWDNRWRWTHIHWRWGVDIYYVTLRFQIFPSIWPFYHAERWDHKIGKESHGTQQQTQ